MAFIEICAYTILTICVIVIACLFMSDADLSLMFYYYLGKKPETLKGKVVWVTGASGGIGESLVYDLARAGCKLVLSSRRKIELESVRRNCIDFWDVAEDDIMVIELDLLKYESHEQTVRSVLEKMKQIDILVNNGGRSQRALVEETEFAVDKALMDLNFLGTVSLTKHVLPHFRERKQGHIVVTSSVAGKLGAPLSASYSASKFALQGWFDTLRIEFAQYNVKVTMVCPGPVYSNITDEAFTGQVDKKHGIPQAENENRMMTKRCTELMTAAIANQCPEVWLSNHPVLFFTYMCQYAPSFARWMAVKAGMRTILKFRESKL